MVPCSYQECLPTCIHSLTMCNVCAPGNLDLNLNCHVYRWTSSISKTPVSLQNAQLGAKRLFRCKTLVCKMHTCLQNLHDTSSCYVNFLSTDHRTHKEGRGRFDLKMSVLTTMKCVWNTSAPTYSYARFNQRGQHGVMHDRMYRLPIRVESLLTPTVFKAQLVGLTRHIRIVHTSHSTHTKFARHLPY